MKRIYSALLLTVLPVVLLQAQTSNSLSTSTMVTTPNTFTYSQPNTISTFDRVQKYRFTDVPSNFWAYESIFNLLQHIEFLTIKSVCNTLNLV